MDHKRQDASENRVMLVWNARIRLAMMVTGCWRLRRRRRQLSKGRAFHEGRDRLHSRRSRDVTRDARGACPVLARRPSARGRMDALRWCFGTDNLHDGNSVRRYDDAGRTVSDRTGLLTSDGSMRIPTEKPRTTAGLDRCSPEKVSATGESSKAIIACSSGKCSRSSGFGQRRLRLESLLFGGTAQELLFGLLHDQRFVLPQGQLAR